MVAATTRTSTLIVLLPPSFVNCRVLQHVQQLGLQRRLHLADFVEEDGPAVRLFELADACRRGAGERALLVTEEFALEQLSGSAAQLTFTNGFSLRGRPLVDRARDQFFADAALAADQHRHVAVGDLLDDERDLLHRRAVAPPDERAL